MHRLLGYGNENDNGYDKHLRSQTDLRSVFDLETIPVFHPHYHTHSGNTSRPVNLACWLVMRTKMSMAMMMGMRSKADLIWHTITLIWYSSMKPCYATMSYFSLVLVKFSLGHSLQTVLVFDIRARSGNAACYHSFVVFTNLNISSLVLPLP